MIKQTAEKNSTPPPFPQALKAKKKAINQAEMLEVLRQVKVNIPLLYMIKQVPTYAKILKDLCTVKRGVNFDKKAFLTEQVNAIIQCKTPVKYKDSDCPTILANIGGTTRPGCKCESPPIFDVQVARVGRTKAHLHHIISCG